MDYIRKYIKYCKLRMASPLSIEVYERELNMLKNYLHSKNETMDNFTPEMMYNFIRDQKRYTTHESIKALFSHIKSFYNWMEWKEFIIKNPVMKMKIKLPPPTDIKPLTEDELKKLIKTVKKEPFPIQHKAIFFTLISSGLRSSELCAIKKDEHLDMEDSFIILPAECVKMSRKSKQVPFSNDAKYYIEKLIANDMVKTPYLFHQYRRKYPLNRTYIRDVIKQIFNRGLPDRKKKLGPHLLRHTFATNWISSGRDRFVLKEIMGWTGFQQIERYVNMNRTQMKKAIREGKPMVGGP